MVGQEVFNQGVADTSAYVSLPGGANMSFLGYVVRLGSGLWFENQLQETDVDSRWTRPPTLRH